MKRLERAIVRWAEVTDGFVSPWNLEMWVNELENRSESEDRQIFAMKYLISHDKKPNLDSLKHIIDNNFDRDFVDMEEMKKISNDGIQYFNLIWKAMNSHNHWEHIRAAMEWGKERAPKIDWTEAIHEAEVKMRGEFEPDLPEEGSQEPLNDK